MLLEEAHTLAELGRRILPIAVLADGDLEHVLGARNAKRSAQGECRGERLEANSG
ncbi:MAG TPA: hypothetical protein VII24_13500 [Pseudolabrys sp.]